jgi:hypothetical protein
MKNNPKMSFNIYTPDEILILVKLIRISCGVYVASIGLGRGAYRLLVGKLEEKRTPKTRGHRYEDNNTIDLQEAE